MTSKAVHITVVTALVMAAAATGFVVFFPMMPNGQVHAVEASELDAGGLDQAYMPDAAYAPEIDSASATPQVLGELSVGYLAAPIADPLRRISKKPFGIEIHPETSPVEGDKFNGYHVGVDFEAFESEMAKDIPVFAICPGPLRFKKLAKGYGGVAVQSCNLDGEDVTIIYGHLDVATVALEAGDFLKTGDRVGLLGDDHSEETDGVRKHLHLGVRKGLTLDIRGYVKETEDMSLYVDLLDYMEL